MVARRELVVVQAKSVWLEVERGDSEADDVAPPGRGHLAVGGDGDVMQSLLRRGRPAAAMQHFLDRGGFLDQRRAVVALSVLAGCLLLVGASLTLWPVPGRRGATEAASSPRRGGAAGFHPLELQQAESAESSCAENGCGDFSASHSCQCHTSCVLQDNCCPDYQSTCTSDLEALTAMVKKLEAVQKQAKSMSSEMLDKSLQKKKVQQASASASAAAGTTGSANASHDGHSCAKYGCNKTAVGQVCKCSSFCIIENNCCHDYATTCPADKHMLQTEVKTIGALVTRVKTVQEEMERNRPSCQIYGCRAYTPHNECQCNAKCGRFDNCCPDFLEQCKGEVPAGCHTLSKHRCCGNQDGREEFRGNACLVVEDVRAPARDVNLTCQPTGWIASGTWRGTVVGCPTPGPGGEPKAKAEGEGDAADPAKEEADPRRGMEKPKAQAPAVPAAAAAVLPAPSCAAYGCRYVHGHVCQCNDICEQYGNCCADYVQVCRLNYFKLQQ